MNRKQSLRGYPMIRCPKNTQQTDSYKVAAMHLYWNHTSAWVSPPPIDSPYMPKNTLRGVASDAFTTQSSLILETYTLCNTIQ